MIKAGIMGATGYAGGELARLLLQRDDVEITWYGSKSYVDQKYASVFKNMVQFVDDACMDDNMEALAEQADVIFTATPQGFCASLMNETVLSKAKVIDLSADYRIKDVAVYEKWYNIEHKTPEYIQEAVYGLPEINREKIKDASGAGRGAKVDNLYCEVNESIKAYGVGVHRHTPEIEEQLSLAAGKPVTISFTPHLVPMNRGILVTAYGTLLKSITYEEVKAIYDKYYENEYFVRVLDRDESPQTKWVEGSNFVDVNFKIDPRTNRVVMMGAMDNLVKGAAGQAIQNMNIMFGLPENRGLKLVPMFP